MKVEPFHTADKTDVYHNNDACTLGNNIEKHNFRKGTGGYRLCDRCKDLNKPRK